MFNKVREVFTKAYREETEYYEFEKKMLHHFKQRNNSESVEAKVDRLKDENFVSNFKIELGEIR